MGVPRPFYSTLPAFFEAGRVHSFYFMVRLIKFN